MNRQHFDRYEKIYIAVFWATILLFEAWINAESVISDRQRLQLTIENWQPYSWELSSHIIILLLIPVIIFFNQRFPLTGKNIFRSIAAHFIFSLIYSLSHVVGMVLLRKLTYWYSDSYYDFGDWSLELVYEYRKDVYGYIQIVGMIYVYRFITSRLRGEAKVISVGEDTDEPIPPERLLVKKIGKEFILKIENIEWIEAAGNYMNLHLDGQTYPLRETMTKMEQKLDPKQFVRVHRSTIVNLDQIKEIQPLESGDFKIILNNEKQLKLSRRYREKVKSVLF